MPTPYDDDEEASQAMSIDSDAAVAVPRTNRDPMRERVSRNLSFGSASKAAAAALAAMEDGSEEDIEALLPSSESKPKRHKIPRARTTDNRLPAVSPTKRFSPIKYSKPRRHTFKAEDLARAANLVNEDNDSSSSSSSEGDVADDASDAAVAKPRKRRSNGLMQLGPSSAAAAVLEDEHDVEALLPKRTKPPRTSTGPPVRRNGGTHKVRRTLSIDSGCDEEVRLKEAPPRVRDAHRPKVGQQTKLVETISFSATSRTTSLGYSDDDVRSTASRRTDKTHKTLKEIRREKELNASTRTRASARGSATASTLPPIPPPPPNRGWCCGLSKCTWSLIIATGLTGFIVGFVVPMWKQQRTQSQPAPDSGIVSLPSSGDDNSNSFVTAPPVVATTTTTSTDLPVQVQTPSPSGAPTEEPESEEVVPSIDVWSLFGPVESLPMASVDQLSSMTSALDDKDDEPFRHAAQLFVQGTIHNNIRKPKIALEKLQPQTATSERDYIIPFVDTPLTTFDSAVPYPTERSSAENIKYPHGNVARWEELMAKAGVHESDTVQWDEAQKILYVAHGTHIDVVDTAAGTARATIDLPRFDSFQANDEWLFPGEQMELESDAWKPLPPQPFIEQLLLTSAKDHLIVVVSNYTAIHQARVKPLLKDSLVTRLFAYQLTHTGNFTKYELIGEPHAVHGRVLYAAQATSNQHIHIVTSSKIDTTRLLQDPLERLYYPDRHDVNYVDEVSKAAQDKYIPLYVQRLRDEIRGEDLTLLPLTHWITGDMVLSEEQRQLEHIVTAQEHLQELVVVSSLSIVATNDPSATVSLRQAATPFTGVSTIITSTAFLAPPSVQVLGSTDINLTLSVPGYKWSENNVLQEATHILQWELGSLSLAGGSTRAATRFESMGTIPGRLLQGPRQATERFGDDLRLATVMTKQWEVRNAEPSVVEESLVYKSFIHVLDGTTLQPRAGSPLRLFKGQAGRLESVTFLDNLAYVFPLKPASTDMAKKANVQVVDLGRASPTGDTEAALRLVGSIHPIPQGFSPYLHALPNHDGDQELLISIGHEDADSGLANGWMLTLWNATNPSELTPLGSHSLEEPKTITTWKPQTFRVTPHGQVILPMTVEHISDSSESRNGFTVLEVTPAEIKAAFVTHSPVVMSARECLDGGCGLEGKSFWGRAESGQDWPTLLTVEGAAVKLTKLSRRGQVKSEPEWSLSLP